MPSSTRYRCTLCMQTCASPVPCPVRPLHWLLRCFPSSSSFTPTRVVVDAVDALLMPLQRHVGGGVAQRPDLPTVRSAEWMVSVGARPGGQAGSAKAAAAVDPRRLAPPAAGDGSVALATFPSAPCWSAMSCTLMVRSNEAEAKVLVSLGLNTSCKGGGGRDQRGGRDGRLNTSCKRVAGSTAKTLLSRGREEQQQWAQCMLSAPTILPQRGRSTPAVAAAMPLLPRASRHCCSHLPPSTATTPTCLPA